MPEPKLFLVDSLKHSGGPSSVIPFKVFVVVVEVFAYYFAAN